MRLYDRVVKLPKNGAYHEEFYRNAVRVCADNVAQYYYSGTDQELWELDKDFPNMAPPFERMFIEFRLPRVSRSREFGDSRISPGLEVGCEIYALDLRSGVEGYQNLSRDLIAAIQGGNHVSSRPRWVVTVVPFGANSDEVYKPRMLACLLIGEQGELVTFGSPVHYYEVGAIDPTITSTEVLNLVRHQWMPFVHVVFLAFSFMHCKNVELREVIPSSKLMRATMRRHGVQLHRYHVIDIEPMQKILNHTTKTHGGGAAQALHICRGHFKTYRGRGLFGKHQGTYWWGQAVRGSEESGRIHTSYNVGAQRESTGIPR